MTYRNREDKRDRRFTVRLNTPLARKVEMLADILGVQRATLIKHMVEGEAERVAKELGLDKERSESRLIAAVRQRAIGH